MPNPLVVVDLAAGAARIAGAAVAVRPRSGGALEFGGRVIRPLRFGERWRLLEALAASGNSIGAMVLAQAEESGALAAGRSAADEEVAQVLALHLAGARPERAAPGFAAQLALLAAAGWAPREVFDADADLVDLLTADTPPDGGEWTSIVLAAAGAPGCSVAAALRALELDLLGRLGTAACERSPAPAGPASPPAPGSPGDVAASASRPGRPTPDGPTGAGARRTAPPGARAPGCLPRQPAPGDHPGGAGSSAPGDHPGGARSSAPGDHMGGATASARRDHPGGAGSSAPGDHPGGARSSAPGDHPGAVMSPAPAPTTATPPAWAASTPAGRGRAQTGLATPGSGRGQPPGRPAPPASAPPTASAPPPIRAAAQAPRPDWAHTPPATTPDLPGAGIRFPEPIAARAADFPARDHLSPPGRPWPRRATHTGPTAATTVVEGDPVAGRAAAVAAPAPTGLDAFAVADQLAALLDEESDLRGLRR